METPELWHLLAGNTGEISRGMCGQGVMDGHCATTVLENVHCMACLVAEIREQRENMKLIVKIATGELDRSQKIRNQGGNPGMAIDAREDQFHKIIAADQAHDRAILEGAPESEVKALELKTLALMQGSDNAPRVIGDTRLVFPEKCPQCGYGEILKLRDGSWTCRVGGCEMTGWPTVQPQVSRIPEPATEAINGGSKEKP